MRYVYVSRDDLTEFLNKKVLFEVHCPECGEPVWLADYESNDILWGDAVECHCEECGIDFYVDLDNE